jgi:hypothetical protein
LGGDGVVEAVLSFKLDGLKGSHLSGHPEGNLGSTRGRVGSYLTPRLLIEGAGDDGALG